MTRRPDAPTRIGVVKPCCIGDCVMALPTIESLSAAFSAADLRVYVGPHSRPVFEHGDRWDVQSIPDRITPAAAARLAVAARKDRLDLIVVLERSRMLRAALETLAGGRVASVDIVRPEVRHESVAYLDVLRGLAIEPTVTTPVLAPSEEDIRAARQILARWPRPVLLHPGGAENPGATMPDKRWPADRYAALARSLEENGHTVVFSGGPTDQEVVGRILAAADLPPDRSLAGRIDLALAPAVVAQAALFVGGDTGMSHIAAATGTPVVAIFGPTNPRRYRPMGEHVTVLAPEASWHLPDVDLRRADVASLPTTSSVPLDDVVAACRTALSVQAVAT